MDCVGLTSASAHSFCSKRFIMALQAHEHVMCKSVVHEAVECIVGGSGVWERFVRPVEFRACTPPGRDEAVWIVLTFVWVDTFEVCLSYWNQNWNPSSRLSPKVLGLMMGMWRETYCFSVAVTVRLEWFKIAQLQLFMVIHKSLTEGVVAHKGWTA